MPNQPEIKKGSKQPVYDLKKWPFDEGERDSPTPVRGSALSIGTSIPRPLPPDGAGVRGRKKER